MDVLIAFLSNRDMWEIAQKREEILLIAYIVMGTTCLFGLVRWQRKSFYVVAPLIILASILIFRHTMEGLYADRDFYRGFPTSRYIVLGFLAVFFPAIACGLAFIFPRRTANQPARLTPARRKLG